MSDIQIALISSVPNLSFGELSKVSAAIQKQVSRDFSPIWRTTATVDCFDGLHNVPPGYWIVTVTPERGPADGIHRTDGNEPMALVGYGEGWSISASHEILEMIVDPFEGRIASAQSPMSGQGRVDFLVEVCDPCQAATFAYTVNGESVSDFITPNYFDPVASSTVRYSYSGKVTRPFEVLPGGYLSWRDPVSGHSFQETFFGAAPVFDDLGETPLQLQRSFRSAIYRKHDQIMKARRNPAALEHHRVLAESVARASRSRAARLEHEIAEIMNRSRAAEFHNHE